MQKKPWIVNKLNSNTTEILLYGYIGMDDVTAADFVKELRMLEKDFTYVNIRINSGGGSIFDGFTIFNAIRTSKAHIETYIDGVAASMGTVIALAGKKVHMSKVARFMTHRASGFAWGNADEMRQNAELLEGLENSICAIYSAKTGQSVEDCRKKYLTATDKWFNADQALTEKLVDSIYDSEAVDVPQNVTSEKELWNIYNTRFAARLNDPAQNDNNNMKQIFLSPAVLVAMGLTENNTDQASFEAKLKDLASKAANAETLQGQVNQLTQQLTNLKNAGADQKVKDLLDTALNKDKKITKEMSDVFETQYKGKPEELEAVLKVLPAITSVSGQIKTGSPDKMKKYEGKSFEQLDEEGILVDLRADDEDKFFDMWKNHFGTKHRDDKRDE